MKLFIILMYSGVALFLLVCIQILIEFDLLLLDDHSKTNVMSTTGYNEEFRDLKEPIIMWWTDFIDLSVTKRCGDFSCFFTNKRLFKHHPLTKALLFYGSNVNLTDMPSPRDGNNVVWALLHEESPRNKPVFSHYEALSLFNYTSTFSRFSDLPLTTQYLKDLEVLTDNKYFVSTEEKDHLQSHLGLAPVVYIQSDCSTPLNRDSYVQELMKYIKVDSYGACLHNKDLPDSLTNGIQTMMSDELVNLVARYKFSIAIENGQCEDYITEKLWRPLIAGSVPIYIGSPTVKDWLPNNNSAIIGLNFTSPQQLANYLNYLNNNKDIYNSYLEHKLSSDKNKQIQNQRLIDTMNNRKWGINNDFVKGSHIEHFECLICEKIHANKDVIKYADEKHYKCPKPVSILNGKFNKSNHWLQTWITGKYEAKVLKKFIVSDKYMHKDFYEEVIKELSELFNESENYMK